MYRSCKGLLKVCLVKGLREYAIYEEIWSLKRICSFIEIGVHPQNLYLQAADEDLSLLKLIIKTFK